MDKAGIGVAQVPPRGTTRWQGGQRAPERREDDTPDKGADKPERDTTRPTPAPGTGRLVDRIV